MTCIAPHRPAFTILVRGDSVQTATIGYDANHIAYGIFEGKYRLSFVCSGATIMVDPADVLSIEFRAHGAQYCGSCDQALLTWPTCDPAYGYTALTEKTS